MESRETIRIGISSCLLGCKVRFDGGHKKDDFLVGTFGRWVEWLPVCPEVEVGMGTPRESIRLMREGGELRLVAPKSGRDWTAEMREYSARRPALEGADLCGCCSVRPAVVRHGAVKVHRPGHAAQGRPRRVAGRCSRATRTCPSRRGASDPHRATTSSSGCCLPPARTFFAGRWTIGGLVAFHRPQVAVMAHAAGLRRARPAVVGQGMDRSELHAATKTLHAGAKVIATPVATPTLSSPRLRKKTLDGDSRVELLALIEDYRRGWCP
jgi:hypothetical protein